MANPAYLSSDQVLDLKTLTARAAARSPDRIAFTFDETAERLTFYDVERRSNQFAHMLHTLGLGNGDRVGLMLRNRPEFPLAWLGIVKAGAVMVPLNVHYKSVDAGYLLEHSGVKAVICENEFVALISHAAPSVAQSNLVISIGGTQDRALAPLLQHASTDPLSVEVGEESLANIQYTSGTTGKPKGCMLSHGWFLRFAWRMSVVQHGLNETDVLMTAQPFYYVDPQWNVALSLLIGAELVVLDRFHPSSFWCKAREHHVTWFYCLGVMPKLLLKMPESSDDREHNVRYVTCSAIPPRDHQAIEERWGVPWYDTFGMTESGLDINVTPEDHDRLVGSGAIGTAMPTREARIVGADNCPVPRGEVGELVMRGTGLMDGYYRNPEATAETFKNGWLHSGDLAHMDKDGIIYFVGRKKDMIRRSGENIAAAEVEEVITQHEAVHMAAVVPVPDDTRGEEVKAYVVLQAGYCKDDVSPQVLSEFCAERIAYFKIPRYWAYRDDLPRTPSERVIKSELIAGEDDLRAGAYDRVDDCWR
ncbi:MAG: AMP-binding protein [Gammaproteobacteria bacterium]|nr:AMP-binding protein [Gammaproteobacteria bacterium]